MIAPVLPCGVPHYQFPMSNCRTRRKPLALAWLVASVHLRNEVAAIAARDAENE
jgi:ribosomal protein S7